MFENGDHSGPVLDIYPNVEGDTNDAFLLGQLFEQLKSVDACVWLGSPVGGIRLRIPLVKMDEIGLAITYKKEKAR